MLMHDPFAERRLFDRMRMSEFGRLDATGAAYLDFAGSALYPQSLVRRHADTLCRAVLGNPHSDSPSSRASTRIVEDARAAVLEFFDADPEEYCVVFTANASAAAKLVAEAFPFGNGSTLVLSADNHNSVNGIREYAMRAGARLTYAGLDMEMRHENPLRIFESQRTAEPSLFAFPAQSNFSGVQHPLSLIRTAQQSGFRVFLDAAAFVPTHTLSLRTVSPDFVAMSFYKMFGYPTGIGALIAKHDAIAELKRPWFAGGTVDFVSVQNGIHRIKHGVEGFEDGTPNFAAVAAVADGLEFMHSVGVDSISRHVAALTEHALEQLSAINDGRARNRILLYGPNNVHERGATIAFNLVDENDDIVPYEHVEAHARAASISLRGGCFCNPGASEHALEIPAAGALECMNSPRPFSIPRLRECLGGRQAVGALRCSFGIPTNRSDISRLIELLETIPAAPRPIPLAGIGSTV